jgi:hypothetical protein
LRSLLYHGIQQITEFVRNVSFQRIVMEIPVQATSIETDFCHDLVLFF